MDRNQLETKKNRTISRKKKKETKERIRGYKVSEYEVLNFNKAHSVGTQVRFRNTLDKEGVGTTSKTDSRAFLNAAGIPVVFVHGCCSYVSLEALEVIK